MASPPNTTHVKCPGCQAGFDVPVALAGKTIRCTSCKTQLAVPAAGAKASPAAAAAAARSGPPTGRSGPPGKSAADLLPKAKAVRRRDDDDDDDEDDEDDRPARGRRKKAAPSGGIPVPLIIGVVLVLVLAGGGVGAYVMFSGEKTPETSASGTPADGGGESAGGRSVGWKTVQGDGFTVEMPYEITEQETKTEDDGTVMKMMAAEAADKKSGFIVINVVLPPKAQAVPPKMLLGVMIEGIQKSGSKGAKKGSRGPGAKSKTDPMAFAEKVKVTGKRESTVDGHPAYDLDLSLEKPGGVMLGKMAAAGGKVIILFSGHETDAAFESQAKRFIGSLKITSPPAAGSPEGGSPRPGGTAVAAAPGRRNDSVSGQVGSPPGPDSEGSRGTPPGVPPTFPMPGPGVPMPPGPPPVAALPAPPGPGAVPAPPGPPPTFPSPGAGATEEQPGAPPPTFPPPGAPAFPPPGGGEVTPGGGTPGFGNGTGIGFVTPALAAKVEPFYAIAFDAEKGEVYTVSMRVVSNTKAAGTLYRHSYPDFAPKGQWKIPHLGTRAAIDTVNGKLYLASVTTVTPLVAAQKNDRAAAAGDVEVFDLAAVRSGKVEDRADLRPAATISVGAPVRGLDVTADGKTLTVLVARQTGLKQGKSTLRQYDTADRKVQREKDLTEPAWDMTRSADGKALLVIDFPSATKNQMLTTFDPATLAPQGSSLPLPQGLVSDVAPGPDGKLVAAAGTGGGQSGKLVLVDPSGPPQELATTASRPSQNGYARFTPDGKKLLVASHGFGGFQPGLDVLEVSDAAAAGGYKRLATVRSAGGLYVGGHFYIAPDGARVVCQTGVVLATDKITEHVGGPEPVMPGGGQPGGFGQPGAVGDGGQPGAFPGGGRAGPGGRPGPGGFGQPAGPGQPGGVGQPGAPPMPPPGATPMGMPPGGFGQPGAPPMGMPMGTPPGGLRLPPNAGQPGGVQPMGVPPGGGR